MNSYLKRLLSTKTGAWLASKLAYPRYRDSWAINQTIETFANEAEKNEKSILRKLENEYCPYFEKHVY